MGGVFFYRCKLFFSSHLLTITIVAIKRIFKVDFFPKD